MATKEELIAQGFDAETAALLAKTAGTTGGGGLPFPVLKFSYDQKDILVELGVKKGSLIANWKIDNKKLEVSEEGENLGEKAEFYVVASVYQANHFDTQTRSTDIQTDIFFSAFDTPKMIDKKSGLTIKELKEAGKKVVFNNIILMMVKTKDGYKPYLHYLHGTNYYKWGEQLADLGIGQDEIVLKKNFHIKTKKVPTDFQPAWIFEITKTTDRSPDDMAASIKEVSEAIKKFNEWVKETNSGNVASDKNSEVSAVDANGAPEIDIDPDEIPF